MDQGQLELVKSGNRQPVPVTTRYYSVKQKHFVFNDSTEEQRTGFLAGKIFWLSGVLGNRCAGMDSGSTRRAISEYNGRGAEEVCGHPGKAGNR